MNNWMIIELEAQLRRAELDRVRAQPLPPAMPGLWALWRRRLAGWLVDLGLWLDKDASRAAIAIMETTPRLNGSDA